jgi:hypothetical protein
MSDNLNSRGLFMFKPLCGEEFPTALHESLASTGEGSCKPTRAGVAVHLK